MNPRGESLLWIQLLGLAALPLEVLLLLVLFAGADPGPLPALERLLCWGLGALLPALLLWRRPADPWSLLLIQVPVRGRRPIQLRLNALQDGLTQKLLGVSGAVLLLPLTWWADARAGLATGLSPFGASGRLVVLLLSVPLLALMLWQWQQALQAVRLLLLDEATVAATSPLTMAQLEQGRLCLGLPLLLLDPLHLPPAPAAAAAPPSATPPPPPAPGEEVPPSFSGTGSDAGEAAADDQAAPAGLEESPPIAPAQERLTDEAPTQDVDQDVEQGEIPPEDAAPEQVAFEQVALEQVPSEQVAGEETALQEAELALRDPDEPAEAQPAEEPPPEPTPVVAADQEQSPDASEAAEASHAVLSPALAEGQGGPAAEPGGAERGPDLQE